MNLGYGKTVVDLGGDVEDEYDQSIWCEILKN